MIEYIRTDKDYADLEEARRAGKLAIHGVKYCSTPGCHSKGAAEEQAELCRKKGHKVKIVCSKSYHVCIPEPKDLMSVADPTLRKVEKHLGKAINKVHQASGEVISRNEAGQDAVRRLLGWKR